MGQSVVLPEVGDVQGLTATLQAKCESGLEPSVALQWETPRGVTEDEPIVYDIRFRPKGSDAYSEKSVDGSDKTITFTKASGLQPLKAYKFEVRARIGSTAGKWKAVSQYTALTPEPVLNLEAAVNKHDPSVTLNWDPPESSAESEDCITKYDIRFKPEGGFYNEKTVGKSTTNIVLRRSMGLKPLLEYSFEVRGRNAYIAGKWETVTAYVALEPNPVQNLRVVVHLEAPSVDLTWDPPANAGDAGSVTVYHLYFKPEGTERYSEMSVDGSTTSVLLDRESGLIPQTTYDFGVRAQSGNNMGDWKMVSTYVGHVPGPVKDLASTVDLHQPSLTLSWEKPSNVWNAREVAAYEIHFKSSKSNRFEERIEGCYTINVSFNREMGLEPLDTYVFKVRAKNQSGEGEWKTVSSYVGALVPGPVQNLQTVVDPRHPSVSLNWDPPLNFKRPGEVTAYHVRFKHCDKSTYDEITVDVTTTSILLTRSLGLRASAMHDFEVRALNAEAEGEWKIVSTYVALKHGPVQNLSAAVDKLVPSVTLKWAPPLSTLCSEEPIEYLVCFKADGSAFWNHKEPIVAGSNTTVVLTRESGLVLLGPYHFQVWAKSGQDEGNRKEVSAFYGLIPGPVLSLRSALDTSRPSLTLNWDKPNNATTAGDVTKYDIRFRPFRTTAHHGGVLSQSGSGTQEDYCKLTVDEPTTSALLTRESGLKPLIKYDFEVRARNATHEGKWNKVSEYIALAPGPVQNLTAAVDTSKPSVTLNWDQPANAGYAGDVTGYQIRFWDEAQDCYNEKIVCGSTTTAVITVESGLRPLTTSTFEVRACSGNDVSQEWKTVSTFVALVPDPVHNLQISVEPSIPTATLTWDPPQNVKETGTRCSLLSAIQYHVRFKPEGREHYDEISVDSSTNSMVLNRESGLVPLVTSTFEVRAQCGDDLGEWNVISGYIALVPGHIQNLMSILDANTPSLTLTWDKPDNANASEVVTAYDIYFRPTDDKVHSKTTSVITVDPSCESNRSYIGEDYSNMPSFHSRQYGLQPLKTLNEASPLSPLHPSPTSIETQSESGSVQMEGYFKVTVKAPATSVILSRESGLKPLTKYDFEVRARNSNHTGRWSAVSEYIALTPGSVQNLTATVDTSKPSVTLNWNRPANAGYAGDVTKYEIHFWEEEAGYCNEKFVNGSTTNAVITWQSGIRALATFTFKVRAYAGDDVGQEWRTVSVFVALVPGPVKHLKIDVDLIVPSATLTWDQPKNLTRTETQSFLPNIYNVRFKPEGRDHYDEMDVDGSTTSVVLKRESGLIPLTTSMFEVRAQCAGNLGKWKAISRYIGLVPGPVRTLRQTLDTSQPSLTLYWDKPMNSMLSGEVTVYDVYFRPSGSQSENTKHFVKRTRQEPSTPSLCSVDGVLTATDRRDSLMNTSLTSQWDSLPSFSHPVSSHPTLSSFQPHSLYLHPYEPEVHLQSGIIPEADPHRRTLDAPPTSTLLADNPEIADLIPTSLPPFGEPLLLPPSQPLHSHPLPLLTPKISFESQSEGGSGSADDCCTVAVYAPATKIVLMRESGLKPLTKFDFAVRARNADHGGEWSVVSEYIALTPDPVQNLTAAVDTRKPSVTLNWDPPANVGYAGDVTGYQIRFWDEAKDCYNEKVVRGSATTAVITRESGLIPLTTFTFEVRACCGDNVSRDWMTASTFVALVPDPVCNLKISVDQDVPSVALSWDRPRNVRVETQRSTSYVSKYYIRFKPKDRQHYDEVTVDSSATNKILSRESGLIPWTMSMFEVRAQCGDDLGEWNAISSYVGFVPGPVQNLTSFLDTSQPSLTLNWDMPNNIKTTDDIVYDIHFKQRPFKREEGWDQGHGMTADAKPAMGVHSSSHLARKTPTQGGGHRNAPHRPLLSFCPTYHPLLPTSHPPPAPTSACEIQLQIVSSSEQRLTVKAPTTSILLTRESGLIPLTTCDFKVRARSQDGATKWRTVSTCFDLVPGPVQNLRKITDPKQASVRLIWDPPLNFKRPGEVTAYHIRFKHCDKSAYDETIVDVTTTSILLTRSMGIKASTMHDFEVGALNAEHAAAEWKTISAFTVLDPDPVRKLLAAVDEKIPSVTLSWKPPVNVLGTEELTGYCIRFNLLGSESYDDMTVSGATTSVVLTRESSQLVPLRHYHFRVKALSARGEGEWDDVSAYYALVPGKVLNLRSVVDTTQASVTLNWDKPDNAITPGDVTTYDVRFKPYERDSENHCWVTVKAPETSVLLTRQSGLRPLTKYKFEVRARNDGHKGRWTALSDYTALNPDPVQNLTAAVDTHKPSVTLNWNPPANAGYAGDVTKYQIRFWNWAVLKDSTIVVNGSTTTTVITRESGLRPLTQFTFEVRACSGDSVSPEWKPVSTFVALDPGPVRKLSAAVNEKVPSVTLSWKPPVNILGAEELTGYWIRFNLLGSEDYNEMTVSSATTNIVFTRESSQLVPLKHYHFQVKAQCACGEGEWNDVSAYYGMIPGKVQNLWSTTDTSQASVTLNWDKPDNVKAAGDVTTYDIRFKAYGLDLDDLFQEYSGVTVKAPATSVLLTRQSGLTPLTKYKFEVRARNDGHEGRWSGVSGYSALNPDCVENVTATLDTHKPSVTLKWNPPANARYAGEVSSYEIRIWDSDRDLSNLKCCNSVKVVRGSTTTAVITRESGLRPLTTFTFEVRACSGDSKSPVWQPVSTFVALDPGPVRHLSAAVDEHVPSLTLSWKPPLNIQSPDEVSEYQILFNPLGSELFNEMTVSGSTNSIVFTREAWLVPLAYYHFQVRAKSGHKEGEWRDVSAYYALVPGPVQNLKSTLDASKHSLILSWDKPSNAKTSGDVTAYDVRFRPSASRIGEGYCKRTVNAPTTSILLTEETGLRPLTMYDFEVRAHNDGHEGKWNKLETTGVVKLDSHSQEYKNLCAKFRRDWAIGKGPCPSIVTIVKIINPVVSQRFESYRDTLRVRGIEQHYHGTRFSCNLANSAELCNNPSCGACGIARKGFDPHRINTSSFQRFGKGFYFAPNSSKAHDYAVGNRFGASARVMNTSYSSVILCDTAPGRKYTLQFRDPHLSKPPSGYDSIYGKSRGIAGKGELNYDELVIFEHRAINPQYIIFCQT